MSIFYVTLLQPGLGGRGSGSTVVVDPLQPMCQSVLERDAKPSGMHNWEAKKNILE